MDPLTTSFKTSSIWNNIMYWYVCNVIQSGYCKPFYMDSLMDCVQVYVVLYNCWLYVCTACYTEYIKCVAVVSENIF